jgi:hypothetical protein
VKRITFQKPSECWVSGLAVSGGDDFSNGSDSVIGRCRLNVRFTHKRTLIEEKAEALMTTQCSRPIKSALIHTLGQLQLCVRLTVNAARGT